MVGQPAKERRTVGKAASDAARVSSNGFMRPFRVILLGDYVAAGTRPVNMPGVLSQPSMNIWQVTNIRWPTAGAP